MTSVTPTTAKPSTTPTGAAAARPATPAANQEAGADRGIGKALAGAGGKAVEMGKDVAQKGVSALAGAAAHHAEDKARHLLRVTVLNRIRDLCDFMGAFPGGKTVLGVIVNSVFYPYYKQINPESKITAEEIVHSLQHGHTEFLENDLVETFDRFIRENLKDDERAKYEAGDKMVVAKAFKNLAMSQVTTAREPGGLKKIGRGIANFIPFVKKLPDGVKPWVGGAIGTIAAYKLLKLGWKMLKWGIAVFAGVTGLKFIANRFGGGGGATPPGRTPVHGEESNAAAGGGMMSKLMDGAGKLAKIANQAQGGGHGAPGGGIGQALSMLGGGGGH